MTSDKSLANLQNRNSEQEFEEYVPNDELVHTSILSKRIFDLRSIKLCRQQ